MPFKNFMIRGFILVICLLALMSMTACSIVISNKEPQGELQVVKLIRVIDGDTIKIIHNGEQKTVRLLLIDTPETKKPNSCVQPYGKEASERMKELVENGLVEIELEPNQERDKYGRLLAYVYVDGESVQETLLEEGYARLAYIYKDQYIHLKEYKEAERQAKKQKIRIWKEVGYVTPKGFSGCEA
ncbi:thermonuclease family protein [Bacillus safensis]|uniref:TNase-like domain-containing protein n=1 Tax=Bacillus safensis TaxID=561879 RepID=A0A1L6ZPC2_BACIA|nr:thermonuclease family protein [Bacillus safensis]APT48352.1 hypothetical protein BSA145_21040 [Bacillus safensis]